jgi:hypothetical protein
MEGGWKDDGGRIEEDEAEWKDNGWRIEGG